MANAVKFEKLNSSGTVISSFFFTEQEVRDARQVRKQKTRVEKAQKGAPTLQILSAKRTDITLQIAAHDEETDAKLTILRNSARAKSKFRVYPLFQQDATLKFDCIVPVEIPLYWLAVGKFARGDVYDILLREAV